MTPFTGEKPQRGVRLTFSSLIDPFITWFLGTFWDELQAVIAAFNFNATNATSTTSLTVGSGANKSLTTQTGKSYNEAMTIKVAYKADPTIWMLGDLISYDSGTGALVFYPRTKNGSGTYADWVIAQSPTADEVGDHSFKCHSPSGHGSTNNKIRLYTTTAVNVGTAMTITHSATLGTYVTINEGGDYEFWVKDSFSGGTCNYGISVNSNQLTQSITSITYAHKAEFVWGCPTNSYIPMKTPVLKLVPGDIVRVHTDGSPNSIYDYATFGGRKVGNG